MAGVSTPTVLTEGADAADLSAYTTASVSPTPNRLILVAVSIGKTDGTDIQPTGVTGNGITYAKVDGVSASTNTNLSLWRGMSASPTAGAITIDFGGATQHCATWHVIEVDTVRQGANGANAIAQFKSAGSLTTTTPTLTLDNAIGTGGAVLAYFQANSTSATWVDGAGYTALGVDRDRSGPVLEDHVQYDLTGTTTVTATYATANGKGIVAVELSEALSGSATGAVSWAGTATGKRVPKGAATGAVSWAGAATGARASRGAASGTVSWAGTATGARSSSGSAAGAVSWAGAATGARASAGAAAGTVLWEGTATGARASSGAAAGTVLWEGEATGATVHAGSAAGTITWVGAATGATDLFGEAIGTILWAGTATGAHPAVPTHPDIDDPQVISDLNAAGAVSDLNTAVAIADLNTTSVAADTNDAAAVLDENQAGATHDLNTAAAIGDLNSAAAEWRLGVDKVKQNDTAPSAAATLRDGGEAIDLTGATVRFNMALQNSPTKVSAAGVVSDAPNGRVRYDWVEGDTDTPGVYQCEWEVTWGDGTVQTFPPSSFLTLTITKELDTSG